MKHVEIRTIDRSWSSNKKYLDKIRKLMKEEFKKKTLNDVVENPNEKLSIEMNHKVLRIMSFSGKELVFFCHLRDHNQNRN